MLYVTHGSHRKHKMMSIWPTKNLNNTQALFPTGAFFTFSDGYNTDEYAYASVHHKYRHNTF